MRLKKGLCEILYSAGCFLRDFVRRGSILRCVATIQSGREPILFRAIDLHHDAILHGDDDAAEAQSIQGMTDMFEGQLLPVVVHRGCW